MTLRMFRSILLPIVLLCVLPPAIAEAQNETSFVKTEAALNYTALQPGQDAVIAVVLDIEDGYHSQSHTPANETDEKTFVRFDDHPHVSIRAPLYPKGHDFETPALGKLNVYTGKTIIFVPISVKPDAPPGPITLKGVAHFQVCDDNVCYQPEDAPIEIATSVIAAGQPLTANRAELFEKFDPTTFVTESAGSFFGFELTKDAYILAFIAAFFVGMIFNVMPCVLPIVPLKIMGFYNAAQERRSKSVALGAFFSAGIVATFGVLALLVVVFRTLAWGELFGNAWFAGAIVLILVALALQTFGAFEVILPSSIYNVTPKNETYVGNFLFGILTAILSTPCTFGMFLGLLVWATYQPAVIGTSLVMIVGIGMAAPYFVLSAFPEVARKFPRTGPWSELVKQMMGFLLLGAAVYFGRRFLPEALQETAFWWILFAIIAAAGLFLIVRTLQLAPRATPIAVATVIALLLVVPSLLIVLRLTYHPIPWVKYSSQALEQARANGKPVVVKFTATWCGNCQAIEATVYVDDRTVEAVKQTGVTMMKADLTSKDAPGWPLLRSLHPVGAIPFTAIYLPGEDQPRKLAGIYTTGDLLQTLGLDDKVTR